MPLSPQQIAQFNQDGYLVLPHMAAPAACRQMLAVSSSQLLQAVPPLEYEAEVGYPGAPPSLDAAGGKTVRRLRGAWNRDACFRDWAANPALVEILRQLLGEPVCLTLAHHNCIMTKHPDFGSETGWHRDIRYWSYTRPELISVWLALGEENAANGALKFLPGSHRWQIRREQMDDLDFLRPELEENRRLFGQGVAPALRQGDVVLFHSGLFHAAGRNASSSIKSSVVFAYHGQSNAPLPGTRSAAGGDVPLG
jgi:phytanoyl-CoA hydroxylase